MSARSPRRRSSATSGTIRARSRSCSQTKNTSMSVGSARSVPIESRSRSMPAPKPIPGVGGPPISSMSPSYRPPPRLVVQLCVVLVEPLRELLDVGGTAVGVADRVELEHVIGHADAPQELRVELDHFGVDRRIVGADRLDRELPVLAVTAALRA